MLDYPNFLHAIAHTPFARFTQEFTQAIDFRLNQRSFGEQAEWEQALRLLPQLPVKVDFNQDLIQVKSEQALSDEQSAALHQGLMQLHPWRKGPFQIFDQLIDTEWRSDWKWQRLAPHISDLNNRLVLDVGCGSGYHCWRMKGAGAKMVVGIEPMLKYLYQFQVIKHYLPEENVFVLPLTMEDMPPSRLFDTVFSMGVLYHRKSPFTHLDELKKSLRSGGELVLETLVVDGDKNTVFIPDGRYAAMPNVWFLPSALALEHWLKRLGFKQVRTVDINTTSIEEQRSTPWMTYLSLEGFLQPDDHSKTIEGHSAPKRAIIIAEAP